MIYYQDEDILIRDMLPSDGPIFTEEEIAQGWHATVEKYEMRLRDRAEGKAVPLTAEYRGCPAGYISVYPNSSWGAFGNKGLPEIVDFGVLQKYQRRGIGSKLMDAAEEIAARYADTVYLGVGLHNGYGSAQRMYVKRGYIPDGSGAWYRDKPCTPYDTIYTNDDDLVLYMSKELQRQET
ncbi:MAG: GNAT family N-acetyltransferase [Clostridia bacterium]|nr:GNAT family N-acetyltransferase [Clostridia bacterium]